MLSGLRGQIGIDRFGHQEVNQPLVTTNTCMRLSQYIQIVLLGLKLACVLPEVQQGIIIVIIKQGEPSTTIM